MALLALKSWPPYQEGRPAGSSISEKQQVCTTERPQSCVQTGLPKPKTHRVRTSGRREIMSVCVCMCVCVMYGCLLNVCVHRQARTAQHCPQA